VSPILSSRPNIPPSTTPTKPPTWLSPFIAP
jgi:hypothetical protein